MFKKFPNDPRMRGRFLPLAPQNSPKDFGDIQPNGKRYIQ